MSDASPAAARQGRGLTWAILALTGLGVAAVLYVIVSAAFQSEASGLRQFRRGSLDALMVPPAPQEPFAGGFTDARGRTVSVADFRGRVTVVNLWATWCAPCRTEMPTLAALQQAYGDRGLRVAAISLDTRGGEPDARRFLSGQVPLAFFHDPVMATYNSIAPRPQGLPVTLIYDAAGRERARLVGDGDWNSPEARGLVEALLAEAGARPAQAPERAS